MEPLEELVQLCDKREWRLEISYAVRQRRKKTPWAGRIKGRKSTYKWGGTVVIEAWGTDPLDVVVKLLGKVSVK